MSTSSSSTTTTITGTAGNDALLGTSGNDIMDGGGGSDVINAGSGNDTMIFRLGANASANDLYSGGSGIDTVLLQLTQAEWTNTAVRSELQRYISFLSTVSRNSQGEVSGSVGTDFVFHFPNASTLTLHMVEQLAISVLNTAGQYVPIDYMGSVISGPITGSVTEAGTGNANPGAPVATGDLYADDLNGPDDAFKAIPLTAGAYGSYSMTSAGVWTYTLNNVDPHVQALSAGAHLTDSFTVSTQDGTSQVVTVTITGANDDALAVPDTAAGTENQVLTLDVLANDTDVDNGHVFTLVSATAPAGKGAVTVVANKLVFDPGSNFDHLAQGVTEVVKVNYVMKDEFGATSSSTETITITGTNDAPLATFTATQAATEDGAILKGQLTSTDVDDGATATYVLAGPIAGLTLGSNGAWSFDPSDAAYQHLAHDASQALAVIYKVIDGQGGAGQASFTINVTGTNDAPLATFTAAQAATEDGAILHGQLTSRDADDGAAATYALAGGAIAGLTLGSDGAWSFDPSNAAYQHLSQDAHQFVPVAYNVNDGEGGVGNASFTIDVSGTNDAPVITSAAVNQTVQESNAAFTSSGTITFADPDDDAADTVSFTGFTRTSDKLGVSVSFNSISNNWSFRVDSPDFLQANDSATGAATFTVTDNHGATATQTESITVNGTNDPAVISGTSTAKLTETNAALTASGSLSATDVDSSPLFVAQTGIAGNNSYGTFSITPAGAWSYTANSAHDEFVAGTTYTDSITVATADGTSQPITVSILGANDAAVITGDTSGSVTEAGSSDPGIPQVAGQLNSTDVDNPSNVFQALSEKTPYGSYTVTADGAWTYILDNKNPAVDALNGGQTLTDGFIVVAGDGTTQKVNITVNGANDAAVITGTSTGTVVEAGGVNNTTLNTPTATGTLSCTSENFQAVADGAATDKNYGSYGITTDGIWTYKLNNANATVDALNGGATLTAGFASQLTDSFTVKTTDGTEQLVNVTINGANDDAVITPTAITALSLGASPLGYLYSASVASTATDVDNLGGLQQAFNVPATYGHYFVDDLGSLSYNSDMFSSALPAGTTDHITVSSMDGTQQTIDVTFAGSPSGSPFPSPF